MRRLLRPNCRHGRRARRHDLTRRATRALCAALLVRPVLDWTREGVERMARHGPIGWVTNNPEAAKALRAADLAYEQAVALMGNMLLADKIAAIRAARDAHAATCDRIFRSAAA